MRCAGKTALVTGAQQGIGRATAIQLAHEGAGIALNFLDDHDAAEAAAGAIRAAGQRCATIQGDVSRSADVQRMLAEAERELGMVDILVNNAGVFPRSPMLDLTEAEWDHVLDVNLKGAFLCAQAFAGRLVERGLPGAIINVSSVAGYRGAALGVHYSASKAGIVGLTRAMALALASHGIRVNAIAPGLTDTAQPRYGSTEDEIEEMSRHVPLGRMAQPGDIAGVAVFLASDDARHITGQVIHVNGGAYAG